MRKMHEIRCFRRLCLRDDLLDEGRLVRPVILPVRKARKAGIGVRFVEGQVVYQKIGVVVCQCVIKFSVGRRDIRLEAFRFLSQKLMVSADIHNRELPPADLGHEIHQHG